MIEMEKIEEDDKVAVFHFDGVEFKENNKIILKDEDVPVSVRKELKRRGLLPLSYSNEKIGIIARLFGYILGDGYIYLSKEKRKNRKSLRKRYIVGISSKSKRDLIEISEDIGKLGFKASRVYTRKKKVKIENEYGIFNVNSKENEIKVNSNAFSTLLVCLGMPIGEKTLNISLPKWIENAPKWIKRNFLAGFFGAELTKPLTIKNGITFSQPMLTIGVKKDKKRMGMKFLKKIRQMLKEFEVKCNLIYEIRGTKKTIGLRLVISNREENLERLWSKISYEYNLERKVLASLAVAYIRMKKKFKSKLKDRSKKINFITFEEFVRRCKKETKNTGLVFERVVRKSMIPFDGLVYDFTVAHKDHNFVANNFVVSNCGIRLLRTNLTEDEVRPKLKELLDAIFRNVPSGVGETGKIKLSISQLDEVLIDGAKWAVEQGYGVEKDLEHLEENGCMKGANPEKVSNEAKKRGAPQLGTLGAGNHFLEIQKVDKIYLPEVAKVFGIEREGQVTVFIHTGSRGFGHQVCTDYLRILESRFRDELRKLPDRELVYAPAGTKECEDYFAAMICAANYAWTNRQLITHWLRESFVKVLKMKLEDIGLEVVYDVCHNICKIEEYEIDGKKIKVYVHRKGSTRNLPPGHPALPSDYKSVGQPVLVAASMATPSFILVGTERSIETFYSTVHGSGRVESRAKAIKQVRGEEVLRELSKKGILARAASMRVLSEERPEAYKLSTLVVDAIEEAGISKKVARLQPLGVVKG
jgi:tRNA-splicing ligase RtcB